MTDIKTTITAIANEWLKQHAERFGYLYARWQDEREFEDFAEYVTEMQKILPTDCSFVTATKRPFMMRVKHTSGSVIELKVAGGYVSYRYSVSTAAPAKPAAPAPAPVKSTGNPVADAAATLRLDPKVVRARLRRLGVNVSTTKITAAQIIARLK